ncbi:protein far1-related sequence 5-like [Gigaspora margarita]|uniref:Protein far1-related sequence 5-like n=1 Tax=Gigaspora margarita TaxID=4874 RepID=A0A8H4ADY8_GIGMA|nr:protein far1-related sequence 5-like [Gigaspora margarita]
MPRTYQMNCIYHIGQNLPKNLKCKLGSSWDDFIKAWYKARNSLSKQIFESEWKLLIDKYPSAINYLERMLYSTKERWALAWILCKFTAGVQSTQRVEGLNAIIKSTLTSKTSLCIMTSAKLLPEVDDWLAKFLTPPVLSMQRAKIAKALWYNLTLISRKNIDKTFIRVQSECNFYEDLDDFPVTNIDEIVDSLTLPIKEIWEVIWYRAAHKNYVVVFEDSTHVYENYTKSYESLKSQPSITYQDGNAILVSKPMSYLIPTYLAISVGLDAGITAMETLNKFLENFIHQNSVNPERVSTNSVKNNIRSDNESDESDLDISQATKPLC